MTNNVSVLDGGPSKSQDEGGPSPSREPWFVQYNVFSDRKLIKLPNKLHHNPKCCFILKDDPVEWLKMKEEIENNTEWKALGQFEVIQLKEYRKRTKGAIKRRKFLKDFDLLVADNRIRKAFYIRTEFSFSIWSP